MGPPHTGRCGACCRAIKEKGVNAHGCPCADTMERLLDHLDGSKRRAIAIAAACGVLALALLIVLASRTGSGTGRAGAPAEGAELSDLAAGIVDTEYPMDPAGFRLDGFDESLIEYLCRNGYGSSSFLVSPAALRSVLGAVAAGAQGNTRTELTAAAGFSAMEALDSWRSGLEDAVPGAVATSVWADEDMIGPFTESYKADVKRKYGADAVSCGSDDMAVAVDDWISSETGGAIDAVSRDVSGASSILASTLDLRAAWRDAFRRVPGSDLMERTGEYYYIEEDGTKAVAIPLDGGMTFVCLTGSRTGRFDRIAGMEKETVHVVLPELDLASSFDARDLGGFLLSRGAGGAMDPEAANFYNMCQDSGWFVQEILQEVRLEADAQGVGTARTGAAADAAVEAVPPGAKEFAPDGPWSFAVFSGFGTDSQYMLLYGQLAE